MGDNLIHIGTSGWYYEHWKDVFYPKDIKDRDRLQFYSQHFQTVEVNTTFYHLPKDATVKHWREQVDERFIFSLKMSQYITHRKRLLDCQEALRLFYQQIRFLDVTIGPILIQLPPSFKINLERVTEFISLLDPHKKHVFEFRHESWYVDEVYQLLHAHNLGLCITDLGGKLSPLEVTAGFSYFRLHGPKKSYQGSYGTARLRQWKKKIDTLANQGFAVFCYFDNDEKGFAVQDAFELQSFY